MSNEVRDENYYKVYPYRDIKKRSNDEIILVCTPLRFYTKNDEDFMFRWIKKIKCIVECYGMGNSLYLVIASNKIPNKYVLEIMGLFRRYKFEDGEQLKVFMNNENKIIFKGL